MFMDALSAATTTKKDASRKRKRGISITGSTTSKDGGPPTPEIVKPSTDKSMSTKETEQAPAVVPKEEPVAEMAAPLKFYQDTLSSDSEVKDEDKSIEDVEMRSVNDDTNDDDSKKSEDKKEPMEVDNKKEEEDDEDEDEDDKPLKRLIKETDVKLDDVTNEVKNESKEENVIEEKEEDAVPVSKPPGPGCGENGPPSVLVITRRKGPKKQLKWRPQESLEDIRYFELDENERVNVTKTFVDMKQMERTNEREGFLKARKLNAEDVMVEQTPWAEFFVVDDVPPHPDGANSKERQLQADRELTCLKALYFNLLMIPDNPAEPDMEQYKMIDPQIIPLDDVTGNPDAVNNFTNMPWPESRGSPPHKSQALLDDGNMPFPNTFGAFPPFQNGPHGGGMPNNNGWGMNGGGPGPLDILPLGGGVGGLSPGMGQPNFNIPMNGMPPQEQLGNMNGMPNMNNMNGMMNGGMNNMNNMNNNNNNMNPFGNGGPNFGGPPQGFNNNFSGNENNRGRGGGGGGGGWFRGNGSHGNNNNNNWRSGGGGRGGNDNRPWNRNRICKSFQKGYCRNGDKCNFLHPGINCPPL